MTTDELLMKLAHSLSRLVSILSLDQQCSWTSKFDSDLERCQRLMREGHSVTDLTSLSASVTQVFQGMGSFNDYAPGIYDPSSGQYSAIFGTEDFDVVSKEVFDLAILLRVS